MSLAMETVASGCEESLALMLISLSLASLLNKVLTVSAIFLGRLPV